MSFGQSLYARAVGIGGATLLRWQKEPEFQAGYREAKRAAYAQSIARLQQATAAAVSTLLKIHGRYQLPCLNPRAGG